MCFRFKSNYSFLFFKIHINNFENITHLKNYPIKITLGLLGLRTQLFVWLRTVGCVEGGLELQDGALQRSQLDPDHGPGDGEPGDGDQQNLLPGHTDLTPTELSLRNMGDIKCIPSYKLTLWKKYFF